MFRALRGWGTSETYWDPEDPPDWPNVAGRSREASSQEHFVGFPGHVFCFPGRKSIALMLHMEQIACFSAADNNRLERHRTH